MISPLYDPMVAKLVAHAPTRDECIERLAAAATDELLAATDVADLLDRRGESIPRMTIYNVMADLTGASLVMPADIGPGKALYEASDVWHHHFVCRGCGRIEDVPCWKGRKPCLRPPEGPPGAVIDEAQVIFRGLCAECAATSAPGKRS